MPEMASPGVPATELSGGYWAAELPSASGKEEDGKGLVTEENKVPNVAGIEEYHAPTQAQLRSSEA